MKTTLGFKVISTEELDLKGKCQLPKYADPEFLETIKGRNISDEDIFFLYQSWLSARDFLQIKE